MGNWDAVRSRMKPKAQGTLGMIEIEVDIDGAQQFQSLYAADEIDRLLIEKNEQHFQLAKATLF